MSLLWLRVQAASIVKSSVAVGLTRTMPHNVRSSFASALTVVEYCVAGRPQWQTLKNPAPHLWLGA